MDLRIKIDKRLKGKFFMPPSKSIMHRLFILASFSDRGVKIYGKDLSKDLMISLEILKKLGNEVLLGDDFVFIKSGKRSSQDLLEINFGESGSSLRFFLPYLFREAGSFFLKAEGRLSQRPIGDLIRELSKNGVSFSSDKLDLYASGKLIEGNKDFVFPGNISSQYMTGIMLVGAFLDNQTRLKILGPLESKPYFDMTLSLLRDYGIKYDQKDTSTYIIEGGQTINMPEEIYPEGDYSNALTLVGLGLARGEIEIENLKKNSIQGDRLIIDYLIKKGANIEYTDRGIACRQSKLSPLDIDCSNMPDLVPVLSAIAHLCSGPSTFRNIERLIYKESDRIRAILELQAAFGARAEYESGILRIYPSKLRGGLIPVNGDHRLVMAGLVMAAISGETTTIRDFEAVNKSFPSLYEIIRGMEKE